MILHSTREQLLSLVQIVIGVVEKRNTAPVLSNILVTLTPGKIVMTATDTEIEIKATDILDHDIESARFTIPGRKFFDILKSLPDQAAIELNVDNDIVKLSSGAFKVNLFALPADQFPDFKDSQTDKSLNLIEKDFKSLLESVQFAMANQDARYFLNGMLFESLEGNLKLIATDGHRMSVVHSDNDTSTEELAEKQAVEQYIVPRKAVTEIIRLLNEGEREIKMALGGNVLQLRVGDIQFSSRLIDGKYPDYQKAIPKQNNLTVIADKQQLKSALQRALIMADERRAAKLHFDSWQLAIESTSNEQDNAEEIVEINYEGDKFDTGFNLSYLLDVLNVIKSDVVHLHFKDGNSPCLMQGTASSATYIISPMRI